MNYTTKVGAVMERQENFRFATWSTQQLREWVEAVCLLPDSITTYDFETCLEAVEELNIREGVYEELEMLY